MPGKILVVDDEEVMLEILSSILVKANIEARPVNSARTALALLDAGEQVDLVLSGLMMPDTDGIEFLNQMQQKYSHIPFVFVTAVHDEDVKKAALAHGASGYVLKPFESKQIVSVVRRFLK